MGAGLLALALSFALPAFQVVLHAALADNLTWYFELNEASGNAIDSVAAANLTDTNTVTSAAGKVGNARDYTAANSEYFTGADSAARSTGDIDFTLAGWAWFDSAATAMDFLSKWETGQQEFLLRRAGVDVIQFYVSADGSATTNVDSAVAISTGTWYFIAARHDSTNNLIRLRVDTTDATAVSHAGGVFDSSTALLFGAILPATPTNFLDGRMDEWGFWKRHLSDAELTTLYDSGTGMSYSDITGGAVSCKGSLLLLGAGGC